MYNLTKLLTVVFAFVSIFSFSQDKKKSPLTLSGSVDAYYQTFLTSSDRNFLPFETSFVNQSGFALGLANVVLSYEGEKTGAVADLAYGPRGAGAVGGDVPFVNQLYAYCNVSESTTLTLGRFNTYLGYEVISPTGNFNYSTSHLFSNGPFSHVGLKADFELSDDFSLMLALMNVTDTNNNITGDYAVGGQLGYKGQFLNLYYDWADAGTGIGFEIDYTGGFDLSEEFYLGINAAYNLENDDAVSFYGVAIYPQYTITESFDLGLRAEVFGLHADGLDDAPLVFSPTLTGSYTVENLTIKPEVRLDAWSNRDGFEPFLDNDGAATDSQAAFTVGAIYSF